MRAIGLMAIGEAMASPRPRPKAYSYIRFSTPDQAKGDSYRRQFEKAQAYALQRGLDLDAEFSLADLGVSAFKGRNAQTGALRKFLDAAEAQEIRPGSFLLVESLDRITRDAILAAQGLFLQIIDAGITLVTLVDQREYSTKSINANPTDLIISIVSMIRGHEESATKALRVSAAYDKKRADAAAGLRSKPFTRRLPAWLSWDDEKHLHVVSRTRAALLKEIFEKAAVGWGKHRIAKWLNERNVDTWGDSKRKAKYWHASYIHKLLTNRSVVGTFTPHREMRDVSGSRRRQPLEPIENYFPTVIDGEVFELVSTQARAAKPRGRNADIEPKSIFAGLLKCVHCGGTVTRVSKGEYVYLVCSKANARAKGCVYQTVRYQDVEDAILTNARVILRDAPRGLNTADLDRQILDLQQEVSALGDEAQALAELAAKEKSDAARHRLMQKEAAFNVARANLQKMRAEQEKVTGPSVRRKLETIRESLSRKPLDVAKTNRALKQIVREIVLNANDGTLEIRWQHSDDVAKPVPFHSRHVFGRQRGENAQISEDGEARRKQATRISNKKRSGVTRRIRNAKGNSRQA